PGLARYQHPLQTNDPWHGLGGGPTRPDNDFVYDLFWQNGGCAFGRRALCFVCLCGPAAVAVLCDDPRKRGEQPGEQLKSAVKGLLPATFDSVDQFVSACG